MYRRLTATACAFMVLVSAACTPSAPALPTDASPAAVSEEVRGSGGSSFLGDITSYEWPDDGRHAGELLSWIPRDAKTSDPETANRAGATAHAIATFLADHYNEVKGAGATNPALIQAYATALIPYLGAMVGDPNGTSGFEPLDSLDSSMPRTAEVFAVMATDAAADHTFIDAASSHADTYEKQFADLAAADPTLSSPNWRNDLLPAARIRGLIKAGSRLAGRQPDPTTQRSVYELQYLVVSRMVRGSAPFISPEYFNPDGSLKSADEIDGPWSRYNAQLGSYLTSYPQITDAIKVFQDTFTAIGQP